MSDISKVDKNFVVDKSFAKDGLAYYNVLSKPFKVYGLMYEDDCFVRLPRKVAADVNEGVARLCFCTAGGRVRFRTNSKTVAIEAKMHEIGRMPHFALSGSAGFDLYDGTRYIKTYMPPYDLEDGYESTFTFEEDGMHDVHINFPTYSGVKSLHIGLEEGAVIEEANDYRYEKPVVYYGSSITQGGCVSRPGNTYQEVISRSLGCNYTNLGFSGSARAEKEIAEYIASLDMSVFVYDYDHNAPKVGYLEDTHEPMFKIIREKNPELPVIMVSRPDAGAEPGMRMFTEKRKAVIQKTYYNAIQNGDTNVYFVDGSHFYDVFGGDSGSVDGCHPNDLGFMCMAKGIGEVLEKIL